MPGYLKQATAAQSRALGPFLDDTDFKTAETGLTIANTDIKLVVNGGASANKNSGGGTHRVNGVYGVTFDATDTATVGEMEVSVVVAGALPVFDKFIVLEEAVYDALFAAAAPGYVANAPVNVAQFGGANGTFSGGRPEVNTTLIEGSDATNQIRDAVVDDATRIDASALNTLSSHDPGETIMGATDLGTGAGLTSLASASDQAAIKAKTDNLPSDPADASDIAAAFGTVNSNLSTIAGYIDTEVAAIKTVTDKLDDTLEDQGGGTYGFTEAALQEAPTGSGSGATAEEVWEYADRTLTANPGLDAAGVRSAVGLDSADLDTQLGAIKAKTDNLPASPAATSDIPAGDIAAIRAKTDQLTFSQAGQVDANVQRINDVEIVGDGSGTPFDVA